MKGKRGPVPRGAYHNKSRVLSTRIREDTRTALEQAASESGKSLSQEIEHRLRRSFDQDERVILKYGTRRNYAVLRIIASLMESFHKPGRENVDWLDDPEAFQQLVRAVNVVLRELAPADAVGESQTDLQEGDQLHKFSDNLLRSPMRGTLRARALLGSIHNADPALPVPPDAKDPSPFIRSDLGSVAERIANRPIEETLREMRELDRLLTPDQPTPQRDDAPKQKNGDEQ
jgi:hypothetical protein